MKPFNQVPFPQSCFSPYQSTGFSTAFISAATRYLTSQAQQQSQILRKGSGQVPLVSTTRNITANDARWVVRNKGFAVQSGFRLRRTFTYNRMDRNMIFVCDIQEGFRKMIHEFDAVVNTTKKVLQAAEVLGLPILSTTQHRTRLGPLVPELEFESYRDAVTIDKTQFSMITQRFEKWIPPSRDSVALLGIESHVCILQTALDLLARNYKVYLITDGISSRNPHEIPVALHRLQAAGAILTTSESYIYEVMQNSGVAQFERILAIVKHTAETTKQGLEKLTVLSCGATSAAQGGRPSVIDWKL